MLDMRKMHLVPYEKLNVPQRHLLKYENRQNEFTQKRYYANERDALIDYIIAVNIINIHAAPLYNRTRDLEGGYRDFRMIQEKSSDILARLLLTATDEQQRMFCNAMNTMTFKVGVKSPAGKDATHEAVVPILRADLKAFQDACRDHCLVCDLDQVHEKDCPLRKALDNMGGDAPHDRGCGYKLI